MKTFVTSTLAALLCLAISNLSPVSGATTTDKPATERKIPFHGKLQAVDTSAETITIEGKTPRVFHMTSTTKITDGAGETSTLSAATVGEDVGGSYTKDASGKMTLYSVRFGAKTGEGVKSSATTSAPAPETKLPTAAPKATPTPTPKPTTAATEKAATPTVDTSKKYKFTGTVVSVGDESIVVHGKADETYAVTDSTKITDAGGKDAKLSSFKAGARVSGSYTKAADGTTFTVTALKLSK